jgi:hypothetical protein
MELALLGSMRFVFRCGRWEFLRFVRLKPWLADFPRPTFATMKTCDGKRKHAVPCGKPLYRCRFCGAEGCEKEPLESCTGQAFELGKCLSCGRVNTREIAA